MATVGKIQNGALPATAPRPRLTNLQIFTMSFGFMGIQFGFALQNGNTSRILRSFGADVDQLPAFWLVAPVVGIIAIRPGTGWAGESLIF
jgi:maltose/moltooligosaccharide transporter